MLNVILTFDWSGSRWLSMFLYTSVNLFWPVFSFRSKRTELNVSPLSFPCTRSDVCERVSVCVSVCVYPCVCVCVCVSARTHACLCGGAYVDVIKRSRGVKFWWHLWMCRTLIMWLSHFSPPLTCILLSSFSLFFSWFLVFFLVFCSFDFPIQDCLSCLCIRIMKCIDIQV